MNAAAHGVARARRNLVRAGAIGGVLAWVLFAAVLSKGRLDLFRFEDFSQFLDAQAEAFTRLRWDIPIDQLGFEAFVIDGKAYTYYGPVPSILRLPVALLSDAYVGRLAIVSMLLAFGIGMWATVRLALQVRALAGREDAPPSRLETWLFGAFVFVVGAGSVLLFLGSRAWVYQEVEIWGAALAIAAFERIIAATRTPTTGNVVWACALTTLAFLTRASVGLGPVAALGLLALAALLPTTRRFAGLPATASRVRDAVAFGIAAAIPAVLYVGVNFARFGTLLSLPLDRQAFSRFDPARKAALAANDGSLFGLKFLPTNLWAYLRPDGIRPLRLFPWIEFPAKATIIGDVTFDTVDFTASLPASMPALTVLAIVGAVAVCRRGPRRGAPPEIPHAEDPHAENPQPEEPRTPSRFAALRAPILGGLAGAVLTMTIAWVTQRYLADFMPVVVVLGAAGMQVLVVWMARTSVRARRLTIASLVALAAFSVWANLGLALLHQRQLSALSDPDIPGFVGLQYDIQRLLPGGAPPYVERVNTLGRLQVRNRLVIVGDCDGVYWSRGDRWLAVERTNATGEFRFRARFDEIDPGVRSPIVTSGPPEARQILAVRMDDDGRYVFGFSTSGDEDDWLEGPPVEIEPGEEVALDVVLDPNIRRVIVEADGALGLSLLANEDGLLAFSPRRIRMQPLEDVTIGRSDLGGDVAPVFAGTLDLLPSDPTFCRELEERLDG